LVKPTFTGGPQSGHAPLFAQFQGDVTVLPPLVLAKFRGEPGGGEIPRPAPPDREDPEPVTVISWLWNFGDGSSGTGQNTSHTYTDEGCHDVTLTVILSNGMSGSITRKDFICVEAGNRPPVADAGPDQTLFILPQKADTKGEEPQFGVQVQLDGSGSFDPDDDPITYKWTFLDWPGMELEEDKKAVLPAPTLSDSTAEMPTFFAESTGDYVLQLIVDDGQPEDAKVASDPDTVTITVEFDENPIADAGPDQNVCTFEEVQLDGSASFDPEGLALTFEWTVFTVPLGSNVDTSWLSDANGEMPTFVPDMAGDYVINLEVRDPANLGGFDQVTISASDPQTNMIAVGNDNFTQGPSQTEIDAMVPEANELPPMPWFVGNYSVDTYEVTNCLYAFVLNYANGQGYFDVQQVKVFPGGNPTFNGEVLIQIEDIVGEDEFCDIEYDAVHDIFFIARRDNQSMARHPVVEVSWYGALAFCNWLSEIESLDPVYNLNIWDVDFSGADDGYRLGFEAEWEYAAAWDSSGQTDVHHIWGFVSSLLLTDINTNRVNYSNSNLIGLANVPMTTPVGFYDGNNGTTNSQSPIGAYDMSGNVWEWIYEEPYSYQVPGKGAIPNQRLVRSGSYADAANDVRSARREGISADSTLSTVGLRVFQGGLPIGK
jgi:formylglycine-generating enzyme required for sulfatase activity/PKD repeat protein